MEHTNTDCRNEEGVTVSLIDGIIATARVLVTRDLKSNAVQAALKDLAGDEDVLNLLLKGSAVTLSEPVDEMSVLAFSTIIIN